MAGPKLNSLQVLRGLAALAVVAFHTSHSFFSNANYWPDTPFAGVFEFGDHGVEVFFVLSGYIIFAAHRRDIGRGSVATYARKRVARIFPAYWVLLALLIPVLLAVPSLGEASARTPMALLSSVTLVHVASMGSVVSVAWSLFHEILFYTMFAVLIAHRRAGCILLGAWFLASVVSIPFVGELDRIAEFYASPLHLLFGMGMATAWLCNRRLPAPRLILAAGVASLLAVAVTTGAHDNASQMTGPGDALVALAYGLASALVIAGLVQLEQRGRAWMPRSLVAMGGASYSIYLVHVAVLSVLAKLLHHLPVAVPHAAIFLAMGGAAVLAGILYHQTVEAPLAGLLSGRKRVVAGLVAA